MLLHPKDEEGRKLCSAGKRLEESIAPSQIG
jgi:hypothetical protein